MPLRWDLLRHGLAERDHPAGDDARGLAPEGVQAIQALGTRLGGLGWRPERVVSSPLRRAIETAERVLEAARVRATIETVSELEPERDPAEIVALLADREGETRHWLLVGHQPLMGRLVEHVTGVVHPVAPGEFLTVQFDSHAERRRGRLVSSG